MGSDPISEARELLSRARRVASGDIIMPDDVNLLVDVASKLADAIEHIRERGIELIHAVFPTYSTLWNTYKELYEDVDRDALSLDVEEGALVYLYTSWCSSRFTVYLNGSVVDTIVLDPYSYVEKLYTFSGRVTVEVEKGDCYVYMVIHRVFLVDGERRLRIEADELRKMLEKNIPEDLAKAVSRTGIYIEAGIWGDGIQSIYVNGEHHGTYALIYGEDKDFDVVVQGHGYFATPVYMQLSELELSRSALVLLADLRDEPGIRVAIARLCEKGGGCDKLIPYYTRPVIRYGARHEPGIAHIILLLLESDKLRKLSNEYT